MKIRKTWNIPVFGLAAVSLLIGLLSGLVRMGWWAGSISGTTIMAHGSLMITGFLGTLIALERAIASNRLAAYLIPLLSGVGTLGLWLGLPAVIGQGMIVTAALLLTLLLIAISKGHFALHSIMLALGGVLWFGGNLLWWWGMSVAQVVPWWAGFLVLTIAAERLELARLLRHSKQVKQLFGLAVAVLLAGIVTSAVFYTVGMRLTGLGLIAISLWLGRFDIARRTVRKAGQTRFIAICLLSGYVWLFLSGLTWLIWGGSYTAGPIYGTLLHALFVGFIFSLIFGHAPIVAAAVTGQTIPYHPLFYGHLILLHLSLVMRVMGNLEGWILGRQWGGMLNAIAILWFIGATVGSLLISRTRAAQHLSTT